MTKSKQETDALSDFLCFALYSTHHAMNRTYKSLLKEINMTYTQFLVMVALWDKDEQLVSDIGKSLFLESSTLTPLLKKLESIGYIKRTRDKQDERKVRITLTQSGRELQQATHCFPESLLKASGMKPEKIKTLTKDILKLRKNLLDNINDEA